MAGMGTRMRFSETTKGNGLKKLEEKTSSRSFNNCTRDNILEAPVMRQAQVSSVLHA